MIDNSAHPQLSCLINDGETMDTYIEQSKVQLLCTWATEIEIIASVLLLQTTKCLWTLWRRFVIVKQKQTSIITNEKIFNQTHKSFVPLFCSVVYRYLMCIPVLSSVCNSDDIFLTVGQKF